MVLVNPILYWIQTILLSTTKILFLTLSVLISRVSPPVYITVYIFLPEIIIMKLILILLLPMFDSYLPYYLVFTIKIYFTLLFPKVEYICASPRFGMLFVISGLSGTFTSNMLEREKPTYSIKEFPNFLPLNFYL